jgi:hypothetical protein
LRFLSALDVPRRTSIGSIDPADVTGIRAGDR